jgi:cyclophilin family peptidyl-prolyl cis-trans isomerase/HEAT repeat protein
MHAISGRAHPASSLAITAVALIAAGSFGALAAPRPAFDPAEELRLRAGVLRAEDERDASHHLLRATLASRSPELRARAVRALGRIGDESTVPLVRLSLVDPVQAVQREAVFALGEIESANAIDALEHVLGSKDAEQRALAAEALAKIAAKVESSRERCGLLLVHHMLRAGAESDPAVVRRALLASWRCGAKTPGLAAAVSAAFLREDSGISEASIYAASRLADRRHSSLLELAARDARPTVRAHAARGLGRLARLPGDEADKSPAHRAILVRRGLDFDPLVRMAAFGALEAFPPNAAMAAEMLAPSLSSEDHGVQRAALSLVRAWGMGADAITLGQIALADDLDLVPEAAGALVSVAGSDAAPILEILARNASWIRRAAAAEALAKKGPFDGIPVLDSLLRDPDVRVVAAALDASIASGRPDAIVLALAHLGAGDVVVRAVAAGAIPDLVGPGLDPAEATTALRRAWMEGLDDASPDARLAVLEALGSIAGENARPDLLRALNDPDSTVRMRARAMLKEAGISPLPAAGVISNHRPSSFYLDAARDERDAPRRRLRLETSRGVIDVDLLTQDAVLTVRNLCALARGGFFDGLTFHRVVPGFVAQGGDPRGDGWGGPSGATRCEINRHRYGRGAAGMALSGKDTGGSQFFFTLTEQPHLDGGYTIFGTVAPESLAAMDQIRRFDVISRANVVEMPEPRAAAAAGRSTPERH